MGLDKSVSTLFIEPMSSKPPNRADSQYLFNSSKPVPYYKACRRATTIAGLLQDSKLSQHLLSYFPSSSRVGLPANPGSGKSIHGFPGIDLFSVTLREFLEPVMMIDLTGSLKEMSKLVLKAVFVAWNWNCNQWLSGAADYFSTIPSNCKRLKTLFRNSPKMQLPPPPCLLSATLLGPSMNLTPLWLDSSSR